MWTSRATIRLSTNADSNKSGGEKENALSVRQYNATCKPRYGKIGWEKLSELNGEDTSHA